VPCFFDARSGAYRNASGTTLPSPEGTGVDPEGRLALAVTAARRDAKDAHPSRSSRDLEVPCPALRRPPRARGATGAARGVRPHAVCVANIGTREARSAPRPSRGRDPLPTRFGGRSRKYDPGGSKPRRHLFVCEHLAPACDDLTSLRAPMRPSMDSRTAE
jgi:hypothetical protein